MKTAMNDVMSSHRAASGSASVVTVCVRSLVNAFEKETHSSNGLHHRSTQRCVKIWNTKDAGTLLTKSSPVIRGAGNQKNHVTPETQQSTKAEKAASPDAATTKAVQLPDLVVCSTSESAVDKLTPFRIPRISCRQSVEKEPCPPRWNNVQTSSATTSDAVIKGCRSYKKPSSGTNQRHAVNDVDAPTTVLFATVKSVFEKKTANHRRHHINTDVRDQQRPHHQHQHHQRHSATKNLDWKSLVEISVGTPAHGAQTISEVDRQTRIRLRKSNVESSPSVMLPWRSNQMSSCTTSDVSETKIGSVGRLTDMFNARAAANVVAAVVVVSEGSSGKTSVNCALERPELADNRLNSQREFTSVEKSVVRSTTMPKYLTASDKSQLDGSEKSRQPDPDQTAVGRKRSVNFDVDPVKIVPRLAVKNAAGSATPLQSCLKDKSDRVEPTRAVSAPPGGKKQIETEIEDPTSTALNLSAHKQRVELRQRGSLANRRKPSRASLRASSAQSLVETGSGDVAGADRKRQETASQLPQTDLNTINAAKMPTPPWTAELKTRLKPGNHLVDSTRLVNY